MESRSGQNDARLDGPARAGVKTGRFKTCVRTPRSMTATSEVAQEFKLRVGSDDSTRQLAESRPPCLPKDAPRDVAPVHYIPAKDESAIRDST
jgi:hypothetical protein